MENNWTKTIGFFNKYQKSTREQFYSYMGVKRKNTFGTLDTYRNNLRSAGFLESVDRGMYKRVKRIPADLTISQCLDIIKEKLKKERINKFFVESEIIENKDRVSIIKERLDRIQDSKETP